MSKAMEMKNVILAAVAAAAGAVTGALGGWDTALQTLLVFMVMDYLTGVVVAGVFKRSAKSAGGRLSSLAGFRGLCKKGAELVLVLAAVRLDALTGDGQYVRMAVIVFFIGNEGLSVLENLGVMGVPYPRFLREALEALRDRGERGAK